jgi:acyl-coenzyme A thioesterase PaaI-like protein
MTENQLILPDNDCFGCGQENAHGLGITVHRVPKDLNRILGKFTPRDHMIGFPGLTHGGVIYTALDCMASWSGMVLRNSKALWVLRSATMKYHRPALQGKPLALSATIEGGDDDPWKAIEVKAEARDSKGELLAEGAFKVIPVPPEKFKTMTGMKELPANWERLLSGSGFTTGR